MTVLLCSFLSNGLFLGAVSYLTVFTNKQQVLSIGLLRALNLFINFTCFLYYPLCNKCLSAAFSYGQQVLVNLQSG